MDYYDLKHRLSSHPGLLILRDRNAALVLSFLMSSWQDSRMSSRDGEELQLNLALTLEELAWNDDEGERDYVVTAKKYLDIWCSEEKRYIRRYTSDKGTVVYELTAYSEKTLRWLEDLVPREFVGAESRFSAIHARLKELVEGSSDDRETRIERLMAKRADLDRQIRNLKKGGDVNSFEDWQVRERFEDISRSARDLLSDFKQVEDNFKEITRRLFESEMDRQKTRGSMLQLTLDASDEMRSTPQGRSFYSFWRFLIDDLGRDELNTLVSEVYGLLPSENSPDHFLGDLKYYLHEAGMKILETNHKMAEKLNRILSDSQFLEMHKIREDIMDIKNTVMNLKSNLPPDEKFMFLETMPEPSLPMERPLSLPREETRFTAPEVGIPDNADLSVLIDPLAVDVRVLRRNIGNCLKKATAGVSLKQIFADYPPEKGLGEILAYLEEASRSRTARIDEEESFSLTYDFQGQKRSITLPEVTFIP